MLNREITIQIDQFDGPLALLLYLVQREEMDVNNFNLTEITGQYLDYLNKMKDLNFDVAGEFLYMASTLIHLKSLKSVNDDQKLRLEADGELNILSEEELIARLKELEKFQKLSQVLWGKARLGFDTFVRPKLDKKEHFRSSFQDVEKEELTKFMIDILRRETRKFKVIAKDRHSIKSKLLSLKAKLQAGKRLDFTELLGSDESESLQDIVMTFISLLELARLKKVEVFQTKDSGIYVDVVESIENLDVDKADGFDDEEEDSSELVENLDEAIQVH